MNESQFIEWMKAYAGVIAKEKAYLTELDSAIGDGDHGANMDRGFQAVLKKLETPPGGGIGGILKTVATTLISTVGGASGPLYGTFYLKMAIALGAKSECSAEELLKALDMGIQGIKNLGKAELGDKTMLDALFPALDAFRQATESGSDIPEAMAKAAAAAKEGMEATIPLEARKGRASYLGERSIGHQDPGATSSYFLFQTAADTLAAKA